MKWGWRDPVRRICKAAAARLASASNAPPAQDVMEVQRHGAPSR